MGKKRPALRELPEYDPENNIGAVDRIRFAMMHGRMDALHKAELEQLERWKQVDDWIRSKRFINLAGEEEIVVGRRKLRNLVMAKYDCSWDTAERDIRNAIALFTPAEDDKEYQRSVYIESLETAAEEARERRKYAAYKGLMALAAELRGLDKPDVEESQDKMQAFKFIIEYNPEAIGLKTIPADLKQQYLERWRKKSASDKMKEDAEDAKLV